jgi:hypothetical protein
MRKGKIKSTTPKFVLREGYITYYITPTFNKNKFGKGEKYKKWNRNYHLKHIQQYQSNCEIN